MRKGIYKIFTETDCSTLYATVHPTNRRAARNLIGVGFKDVKQTGNRVTGRIDYLDLLNLKTFKDTAVLWPGKALYWWQVKSKIENIPAIYPVHPTLPVFNCDGDIIDLS